MPLRLYRLGNKGPMSMWFFAENEEEAKDLAMAVKHARKRENLRLVGDQTDFYAATTDIADVTVKGSASLVLGPEPRRWHVVNPLTGERRDPTTGAGMPEGYTPAPRRTAMPTNFGLPYGQENS